MKYLYLLLLILLVPFCYANTISQEWANGQYDSNGYLASSSYSAYNGGEQTDLTLGFTKVRILESSIFPPVLFWDMNGYSTSLESSQQSEKFFYLVPTNGATRLAMYSADTGLLNSLYSNSATTEIISNPQFQRYDSDNVGQLNNQSFHGFFMTTVERSQVDLHYYIYNTVKTTYQGVPNTYVPITKLKIEGDFSASAVVSDKNSIEQPDAVTQYCITNLGFLNLFPKTTCQDELDALGNVKQRMVVLLANGTVNVYQISFDNISLYSSFYTSDYNISGLSYNQPYYTDTLILYDTNADSYKEAVWVLPNRFIQSNETNATPQKLFTFGVYDFIDNVAIVNATSVYDTNYINSTWTNLKINLGIIKSNTIGKAYITTTFQNTQGENVTYNYLISTQDGGTTWNSGTGKLIQADATESNLVSANINNDTLMETCLFKSTGNFSCYQYETQLLFTIDGNGAFDKSSPFISMAYLDSNALMSVITSTGIWDITPTKLVNVYNFTDKNFYNLPLNLIQKSFDVGNNQNGISNDVFTVQPTFIDMYQLQGTKSTCGDGICAYFENSITCNQDCASANNIECFANTDCLTGYCNLVNDPNVGFCDVNTNNYGEVASYCNSNSQCSNGLVCFTNSCFINTTYSCSANTECFSGYCSNGKCSLANKDYACIDNTQCLSNNCVNSKCSDAGSSSAFNQLIKNLFGGNATDGVFFYLICAVVIFILGIVASVYLQNFIPAIVSLAMDLILLVAFTFIGLVSGWVLVIAVVLLSIVAFILMMIFAGK